MEHACCSAALMRLGVASLGCSQEARPSMMLARSWSLLCCMRALVTSSRKGIASGAYPKVPQAQMMADRLRGVSRDCLWLAWSGGRHSVSVFRRCNNFDGSLCLSQWRVLP